MKALNRTKMEKQTAEKFDFEASEMANEHDTKGMTDTAHYHVKMIVEVSAKTALDVGSGPGSMLIELLDQGLDHVTGVDLSQVMHEMAEKRISAANYTEKTTLHLGSFLDLVEIEYDAISHHRTICCHHDLKALIIKTVAMKPKIIVITIPRNRAYIHFFYWIKGIYGRLMGKFWPFAHSQKKMDQQLYEHGYDITNQIQERFWKTTTYMPR